MFQILESKKNMRSKDTKIVTKDKKKLMSTRNTSPMRTVLSFYEIQFLRQLWGYFVIITVF